MNKNYMYPFVAVVAMVVLSYVGTQGLGFQWLFGVVLPYLAFTVFIIGMFWKVVGWARSPVPFRITTTCGQQKSLPWIVSSRVDNPANWLGVVLRVLLEVFCFRSLFRNTRARLGNKSELSYKLEFFLWFGALAFHYAFLVVVLRHLRFFTEPVFGFVSLIERIDGFFRIELLYDVVQFGLPGILVSGLVLLIGCMYLLSRRILLPQVRYISIGSDFFPLFLILGISLTGFFMRYFGKIDVTLAKELTMSLVTLKPSVPDGLDGLFYSHLFLVSVLLFYFPFSKLMHMAGVFLSPTRNMTGNTREVRHINPWNYPVEVHTYKEYEAEYREKMLDAEIPIDGVIERQSDGKE